VKGRTLTAGSGRESSRPVLAAAEERPKRSPACRAASRLLAVLVVASSCREGYCACCSRLHRGYISAPSRGIPRLHLPGDAPALLQRAPLSAPPPPPSPPQRWPRPTPPRRRRRCGGLGLVPGRSRRVGSVARAARRRRRTCFTAGRCEETSLHTSSSAKTPPYLLHGREA